MKYIYKINGKVWKEASESDYRAPEKTEYHAPAMTETLCNSVAFYIVIFVMFGIPGCLGAYVAPKAWESLTVGVLLFLLVSTIEDDDADVRLYLMTLSGSLAAGSLIRMMSLMFANLS